MEYPINDTVKMLIRNYHRLVADFVSKNGINIFIHTRSFL